MPSAMCLFFYFTSICRVELDAEVSVRSPGVATGGQQNPTDGLEPPDDTGRGGCGQQAVLTNHQSTYLRQGRRSRRLASCLHRTVCSINQTAKRNSSLIGSVESHDLLSYQVLFGEEVRSRSISCNHGYRSCSVQML